MPREQALRVADEKKAICAELGLKGVFPFDLEIRLPRTSSTDTGAAMARAIAEKDETLVRRCDAVIANVTPFRSPSADVGTVYEVGFARGLGKPVFGYTNDDRPYAERVLGDLAKTADAKYDATGSAHEAVCDADGLSVEPFGCSDNLMVHNAFEGGTGPHCTKNESQASISIGALAAFRVAAEHAAETLLPSTHPPYWTPMPQRTGVLILAFLLASSLMVRR